MVRSAFVFTLGERRPALDTERVKGKLGLDHLKGNNIKTGPKLWVLAKI